MAVAVIIVASGYGLYDFGRYRGGYDNQAAQKDIGDLKLKIERLSERNELLIDQNAMLDRYSRIDRNAHEEVKTALNTAQQQSIELREELAFYRSLISPSEMEPGLHIQSFIKKLLIFRSNHLHFKKFEFRLLQSFFYSQKVIILNIE